MYIYYTSREPNVLDYNCRVRVSISLKIGKVLR